MEMIIQWAMQINKQNSKWNEVVEDLSEEMIEQWAAMVMQAVGNVMEHKFWGRGK